MGEVFLCRCAWKVVTSLEGVLVNFKDSCLLLF